MTDIELAPLPAVLESYRQGKMVIVVDDRDRENEGDLTVATELITEADVAFMMNEGRGLICASISTGIAEKLQLPLQSLSNHSKFGTPFAISVDKVSVAHEGITARARAETLRHLASIEAKAEDFVSPGHIFPLIANPAGVLGRRGQTEAAFDLSRLCGLVPSGVVCEILMPDGTMARGPDLAAFANQHGLLITSVQEIAQYRTFREVAVRQVSETPLTTEVGIFNAKTFIDDSNAKEHIALVHGELASLPASYIPLVRIHSECLTGDVFTSRRCDCGAQLSYAAKAIVQEGAGLIIYLRQEGRGIGLGNKIKAYELQDKGLDTVEANEHLGFLPDERSFAVAAHVLLSLNITKIRLMTNNPRKMSALGEYGVEVVERIPVITEVDELAQSYLETKKSKLGHLL